MSSLVLTLAVIGGASLFFGLVWALTSLFEWVQWVNKSLKHLNRVDERSFEERLKTSRDLMNVQADLATHLLTPLDKAHPKA